MRERWALNPACVGRESLAALHLPLLFPVSCRGLFPRNTDVMLLIPPFGFQGGSLFRDSALWPLSTVNIVGDIIPQEISEAIPIQTLAVKHSASHFLISLSSAALMCITHSAGRLHVRGKILYSLGKSLSMRLRLRANRSLRQISIMPGKWLIF